MDDTCPMIYRLWNQFNRKDIAFKVSQMLLCRLAITPLGGNEIYFVQLVKALLDLAVTEADKKETFDTLSKLVKLAKTSEHIYIVARELFDRYKNVCMRYFEDQTAH